ncbi:MAG: hypothetical protein JNG88_01695 [Phycisphaerales bacterium]|nr:hypothetical protein [Phycisphaerales bacterium]
MSTNAVCVWAQRGSLRNFARLSVTAVLSMTVARMIGCVGATSGQTASETSGDTVVAGEVHPPQELDQVDVGVAIDEAPSLNGLQIFPPDNWWNTDISAYPVHPNSQNYLVSIGLDTGLHPDFGTVWEGAPIGIPYVLVDEDQPRVDISFYYNDESDPGPYPIPPDAPIEGGPDSDGDRHIIVIDTAAKLLYEVFDAHLQQDGTWEAGSGAIFDLTSNSLRPAGWTSADAAGLPIFAGLVRYDEVVERGEINHALRFTVSRTQRAYITPATHWASDSTDPNRPPMGLRVRLRADFDLSPFTPNVQVILRAMQRYGMFVADNGSNWYISGVPDPRWDDDELHDLGRVRGSDFEVVYTGEPVTE